MEEKARVRPPGTSTRSRVDELLEQRRILKMNLEEIDFKLLRELETYEGTVMQAVKDGLVRLNFAAPSGFYRMLRK